MKFQLQRVFNIRTHAHRYRCAVQAACWKYQNTMPLLSTFQLSIAWPATAVQHCINKLIVSVQKDVSYPHIHVCECASASLRYVEKVRHKPNYTQLNSIKLVQNHCKPQTTKTFNNLILGFFPEKWANI